MAKKQQYTKDCDLLLCIIKKEHKIIKSQIDLATMRGILMQVSVCTILQFQALCDQKLVTVFLHIVSALEQFPQQTSSLLSKKLEYCGNYLNWLQFSSSKSNLPGQLAGSSERASGIFSLFYISILIYCFKYETIVSRNGLSLGYSEQDTSSVC